MRPEHRRRRATRGRTRGRTGVEPSIRTGGRGTLVVAGTALALVFVGGLGFVFSAESASYDAARWQAAEAAVRAGYPIVDVNGGYEWVGWQPAIGRAPQLEPTVAEQIAQRHKYFAGLCVDVVIAPPGTPKHYVARTYAYGLLRRPAPVYALRNRHACAQPPAAGAPGR